jgi:hypothetical protein
LNVLPCVLSCCSRARITRGGRSRRAAEPGPVLASAGPTSAAASRCAAWRRVGARRSVVSRRHGHNGRILTALEVADRAELGRWPDRVVLTRAGRGRRPSNWPASARRCRPTATRSRSRGWCRAGRSGRRRGRGRPGGVGRRTRRVRARLRRCRAGHPRPDRDHVGLGVRCAPWRPAPPSRSRSAGGDH